MRRIVTARAARGSAAFMTALLLAGACGEAKTGAPEHRDASAPAASASLDEFLACSEGLEEVHAARPHERAKKLAAWLPRGRDCFSIAFAGCVDDPRALATAGDGRAAIDALTRGCLDAYCEGATPAPALCADPSAAGLDTAAEVHDAFTDLLAVKFARDFGVPWDDARVQQQAARFARFLSAALLLDRVVVSPPKLARAPGGPPPLEPRVAIRADGFIVTGEGIEAKTIAARPGALDDYARFDFAALTEHARALKRARRTAGRVRLEAEAEIPMQVLIMTMDALRGEGCESAEPDPSADERCLFPYPVVESADSASG